VRATLAVGVAVALAAGLLVRDNAAQAQGAGACTQWNVGGTTWGPIDQSGIYTPTVSFDSHQDATQVSGMMSLPEGQWEAAGWRQASNPLSGTLNGNDLHFLVTAPHSDGSTSRGDYRGLIFIGHAGDAPVTLGQTVSAEVVGGAAKDDAVPNGPTVTWSGSGQATCASTATSATSTTPTTLSETQIESAILSALLKGNSYPSLLDPKFNAEPGIQLANDFEGKMGSVPPKDVRYFLILAGGLANQQGPGGRAAYPSLSGMMPVIMRMAYHATADPDPDSRAQALTAAQRLLAFLFGQDTAVTQAGAH
jgi:hypothetical protein